MSNFVTASSFESLVCSSGLVKASELDALRTECSRETKTATEFAQLLVTTKRLTKWQARKLLDGRHRGFFLGPYRILFHLARGGMSTLYVGQHEETGHKRVLKVLSPEKAKQASYLPRFRREAALATELRHRNIVRAYELLELHHDGSELYCMVMEYLQGCDLYQRVTRNGPLPVSEAVDLVQQAAVGLDYAHQRGLVHRDIKPGNLIITKSGLLKVVDLGLAAVLESPEESVTRTCNERVLGTADYLAPEQAIDSHRADPRADIYALGCTFYFMLAGHAPFPTGSLAERILAHQTKAPKKIRQLRTDVPVELEELLELMLVKRRAQRTQTCREVADFLTRWRINHGNDPAFDAPPLMKVRPTARKLHRMKARRRSGQCDIATDAIAAADAQTETRISETTVTRAQEVHPEAKRGDIRLHERALSSACSTRRKTNPVQATTKVAFVSAWIAGNTKPILRHVQTTWPHYVNKIGPPTAAGIALLSTLVLALTDPSILKYARYLLNAAR